jgi:hypothetical protein
MPLRYALNKNWLAEWPGRIARLRGPRMWVNLPVRASEVLCFAQVLQHPEVAGANRANSPSGCGPSVNLTDISLPWRVPRGASDCLTVSRSGEPLLQRCGKAGIERLHGVTYIGLAVGRAAPICIGDGRFEIGTSR